MGMAAPVYYTAEMVRALPDDGNRYETVHGELLVTPAPRAWHQIIVKRLLETLGSYLRAYPVGEVLMAPADISWNSDVLVQPDVFVVDREEAQTLDWAEFKTLLLVIEVLSSSTSRYDRFTKRRLYQEVQIPAYWIVDAENGFVEVWTPEMEFPQVHRDEVVWAPTGAASPLTIEVKELFKPI
jgi:Uma2 family endonuclease